MDNCAITARSLSQFYKIDGDRFERVYKECLSGFSSWEQKDHAADWMLYSENIGTRCSIDETMLHKDLMTILSNKDGHGKQGSIIATVKGTKTSDVIKILMQIPEEKRLAVEEVTMDFSESMRAIVKAVFPNATIVVDVFHIVKRCTEAIEEIRLKEKRKAAKDAKKEESDYKKHQRELSKNRANYRKKHPKTYSGKKRGRKPQRLNQGFKPKKLANEETVVELLTRSRNYLASSGDKWGETQKERARLLFALYPNIDEVYGIVQSLRSIFQNKDLDREQAREKLHEWYRKVAGSTIREIKSARDAIKHREEDILNFFINRSTNAAAESLNAKIKGFLTQVRGVLDLPFFMYRCGNIFG